MFEHFHFVLLNELCSWALLFSSFNLKMYDGWHQTFLLCSNVCQPHFYCLAVALEVACYCMTRLDKRWTCTQMLRFYANTYFWQRENACENLRVSKWKILTADYFVARTTTNCARCTFVIDLCRCNKDAKNEIVKGFIPNENQRLHNGTFWIMFWIWRKIPKWLSKDEFKCMMILFIGRINLLMNHSNENGCIFLFRSTWN